MPVPFSRRGQRNSRCRQGCRLCAMQELQVIGCVAPGRRHGTRYYLQELPLPIDQRGNVPRRRVAPWVVVRSVKLVGGHTGIQ